MALKRKMTKTVPNNAEDKNMEKEEVLDEKMDENG